MAAVAAAGAFSGGGSSYDLGGGAGGNIDGDFEGGSTGSRGSGGIRFGSSGSGGFGNAFSSPITQGIAITVIGGLIFYYIKKRL